MVLLRREMFERMLANLASVGSFPRMNSQMVLELMNACKGACTLIATKGFLSGMSQFMVVLLLIGHEQPSGNKIASPSSSTHG